MTPRRLRVGATGSPVVVIDGFSGAVEAAVECAAALSPFPPARNHYPGVRRIIGSADVVANDYVERLCTASAPYIAGGFDMDGFDLIEASFSMVTTLPEQLSAPQGAPHFDSTEPKFLALLHYLRVPDGTGTAFYRQRATGIERVDEANVADFVRAARDAAARTSARAGYVHGGDDAYEQIGAVEGVVDRLVIYPGGLLHSGIIPAGMAFSADPREGRLTANLFVRGH